MEGGMVVCLHLFSDLLVVLQYFSDISRCQENLTDAHIGQFSQKYADQPTWTNSDTAQKYYKLC